MGVVTSQNTGLWFERTISLAHRHSRIGADERARTSECEHKQSCILHVCHDTASPCRIGRTLPSSGNTALTPGRRAGHESSNWMNWWFRLFSVHLASVQQPINSVWASVVILAMSKTLLPKGRVAFESRTVKNSPPETPTMTNARDATAPRVSEEAGGTTGVATQT